MHRFRPAPAETDLSSLSSRTAATMAEVLMSMLILSIGVLCLATLFPVGMINSVRASKLTRATMLKENCDTMIDLLPFLVHDPDRNLNLTDQNGHVYAVDPFGVKFVGGPFGGRARYHAGYTTRAQIENLVMLPDSWDDNDGEKRAAPVNLSSNWVQVPDTLDLKDVEIAINPTVLNPNSPVPTTPCRVILLDPRGRQSFVRDITVVDLATRHIFWNQAEPVPPSAPIVEVRIEVWDAKYSWMLTIRKPHYTAGAAPATVNAVIFFNRPKSPLNEVPYSATFGLGADRKPGKANFDDDNFNGADDVAEIGFPGTDDERTVSVVWNEDLDDDGQLDNGEDLNGNGSLDVVTYENRPQLIRGGFIFDSTNGYWYRITRIIATDKKSADLEVDRPVIGQGGTAVAPRGIVCVYPLGTK
jgi:hypothetical protein